jgi:hypothetical protein
MSNPPLAVNAMPHDDETPADLRAKAAHFRGIAATFFRPDVVDEILSLAKDLDDMAAEIDARQEFRAAAD